VETFEAGSGPLIVAQVATAGTPVIAQVPVGVGAIAFAGPVTVAVKVMAAPSDAVPEFATTVTLGVTAATEVEAPEVGEPAR